MLLWDSRAQTQLAAKAPTPGQVTVAAGPEPGQHLHNPAEPRAASPS